MRASTVALAGIGATTAVVVGALAQAAGDNSPIGSAALSASVPAEYRDLIQEAGKTCPEVSPNLLAALLKQESGFNPKASSPVGAQGIAQFMPSTWASHGLDGNGDGKRDVWDPEDAIPSSAKYLCTIAKDVKDVPGDKRSNMLAAYNAGSGAVKKYNGVPPYKETQRYVQTISAAADSNPGGGTGTTTDQAVTVINAAEEKIGTPYSWGGGNASGPSSGICCSPSGKSGVGIVGFDCSGLTLYAYAKAGITLPRTAAQQYAAAEPVKPGQMRPGDLVFYGTSAASIHHVGIYVGNGYILNAPKPGTEVRYDPMDMMSDLYAVARPTQNTNKEI
ncbi:bifunctional lytic transglycosylase/C40 family peptidase [Streptomyces sp. MBT58]|uniref:C40 family peptidase n=1 Tax=Streptomyces sp. MBT58 TaxID=1488389 RepID=UPI00191213A1|nr:bifunctional lytic transglycosylase/C40 family peptidase [Streptomyces sp. MBT58]MBK5993358.1 bifunctional lytic transglycosylase/C40 family peptidase [Streptomyces sp. MBT58]